MRIKEFIDECTVGGPGFDGYAYNADVFCPECGEDIVREIAPAIAPTIDGTDDPLFADSETVPQPIFFGESDSAEYCGNCGEYLYGPLEGEVDDWTLEDTEKPHAEK